jgi:nucleotide-binding universal stress UspA family protein
MAGVDVALCTGIYGEQRMNKHARILCAIDLSRRSEGAFNYAVAIARARRAPLNVLFVVSNRYPIGWRVRERVAQLADLRRHVSEAGVQMTLTARHGNPAKAILEHAASSAGSPELIVLGAPTRGGFGRLWSPSVAQAVVHHTDRPTLVVPGSYSLESSVKVPFRRVLVPIDFSPASTSALDEAYRIIRQDGSSMRLLHVVDIARQQVPRPTLEFPFVDYTELLREHATRQLRRLLPLSQELHGRVHPHVSVGLVFDQIVRNANEMAADLVVLGVTKRGVLGRLLGSTTAYALGRVGRPILAVPAGHDESLADRDLDTIAA